MMKKIAVLALVAGCLLFAGPSVAQDDDGAGFLSGSPFERKLGNAFVCTATNALRDKKCSISCPSAKPPTAKMPMGAIRLFANARRGDRFDKGVGESRPGDALERMPRAMRRARKLARKQMQREGLLPAQPKATLTSR